ncbi:sensor histidine kinase [Neptunomonas sp.]|uniref:sensor histidine kinase n=1 Tax=Neptunomonas TaxID=75687 RepID=UPI003514FF71
MKKKLSLKLLLTLSVMLLVATLALAYSILSAHFFIRGLDTLTSAYMEKELIKLHENQLVIPEHGHITSNDFLIARNWEDFPLNITQHSPPQTWNTLEKFDDGNWFVAPKNIIFAMHYNQQQDPIWIVYILAKSEISSLVKHNAGQAKQILFIFSITALVLIGLIIWLLNRQVTRPINSLWVWAQSMKETKNLNTAIPEFKYPELNKMAYLIKESIQTVHNAVEREHQFLRHTSHELRTPISVIRSNIELFRKLESMSSDNTRPYLPMVDRIDRASLTMKHLTETLLWLNKDDLSEIPANSFRLGDAVNSLAQDMEYLLKNKPVSISLYTDGTTVHLPEIATRIVIGNLIRNAFQHTWDGDIHIKQSGHTLIISNNLTTEDQGDDLGFGLGLQLTQRLTHKFGWPYDAQKQKGQYTVEVTFSSP